MNKDFDLLDIDSIYIQKNIETIHELFSIDKNEVFIRYCVFFIEKIPYLGFLEISETTCKIKYYGSSTAFPEPVYYIYVTNFPEMIIKKTVATYDETRHKRVECDVLHYVDPKELKVILSLKDISFDVEGYGFKKGMPSNCEIVKPS